MQPCTRRQLLKHAGAGAVALALAPLTARAEEKDRSEGFTLPPLPYAYDALEPHIDAETMKIHHDKHHKAYLDNLNAALKGHSKLLKKDIVGLLRSLPSVKDGALGTTLRNNGGGYYNHSLFWTVMAPKAGGEPKGDLAAAIDKSFGSFDKFKTQFSNAAKAQFGSGWAWLATDSKGKLHLHASANQDNSFQLGLTPILGLDVWEHAYYLKYKNLRPKYIEAWWNVVNWDEVARRHTDRKG